MNNICCVKAGFMAKCVPRPYPGPGHNSMVSWCWPNIGKLSCQSQISQSGGQHNYIVIQQLTAAIWSPVIRNISFVITSHLYMLFNKNEGDRHTKVPSNSQQIFSIYPCSAFSSMTLYEINVNCTLNVLHFMSMCNQAGIKPNQN